MEKWDQESVSNSFKAQAVSSNDYLREIRSKIKSNSSYEHLYDEYLAKYYVFESLWGRSFLESKRSLIRELTNMLDYKINPLDSYNNVRFEEWRKKYINLLIKEYSDKNK